MGSGISEQCALEQPGRERCEGGLHLQELPVQGGLSSWDHSKAAFWDLGTTVTLLVTEVVLTQNYPGCFVELFHKCAQLCLQPDV